MRVEILKQCPINLPVLRKFRTPFARGSSVRLLMLKSVRQMREYAVFSCRFTILNSMYSKHTLSEWLHSFSVFDNSIAGVKMVCVRYTRARSPEIPINIFPSCSQISITAHWLIHVLISFIHGAL